MIVVAKHGFSFYKKKSDALIALKNYKVLVKKEIGNQIKVLRTNRGGEYNSHEFVNFCESNGIKRQLTAAIHHSKTVYVKEKIGRS